jgi:hypothetical protein
MVRDGERGSLLCITLSEPTAQELAAVHAFEATHAPADQQRLLASWRQLQLSPALSEIILQRDAFWGRFTRDLLKRYEFLPTRRTIVTRAAALCLKHPLRGFDAIHLASGLQLQETLAQQEAGDNVLSSTYVTSDDRLVTAAQAEGLTVENPFWHTDLDTSRLP